jgi:uncharacterized protein
MKYKDILMVGTGLICLSFLSYGRDLSTLRQKAEQGDAEAQFGMGIAYERDNDGDGVPQDYKEGMKWYRRAAEQGHTLAQSTMGGFYESGERVSKDYKEAVKWYRLAAAGAGKEVTLPQMSLGNIYESGGSGVSQNYVQAYAWFNVAATRGNPRATRILLQLSQKMTPEQIAEGQRFSREYAEKFIK